MKNSKDTQYRWITIYIYIYYNVPGIYHCPEICGRFGFRHTRYSVQNKRSLHFGGEWQHVKFRHCSGIEAMAN